MSRPGSFSTTDCQGAEKQEDEIILTTIAQDLYVSCKEAGALSCDYTTFKDLYRIQAHTVHRTGQSIHIALITLKDLQQDLPDQNRIQQTMLELRDYIISSLRQGDTLAQYDASQYVVMLPLTTLENGKMVINRIVSRFNHLCRKQDISISAKLIAVEPVL